MGKTTNPISAFIAAHIPYGRENAVSRDMLCYRTGMSDRSVRAAIATAVFDDYLIVSRPDGCYYRPTFDDISTLNIYLAKEKHREKQIIKKNKKLSSLTRKLISERLNGLD